MCVRVRQRKREEEGGGEGRLAVRGLRTREKAAKVAKDAFRVRADDEHEVHDSKNEEAGRGRGGAGRD